MTPSQPLFLLHAFQDPACRPYLLMFGIGFFVFAAAASALIAVHDSFTESDWELCELEQPVETYHYSLYGEMRAWDGCVEFIRSGACVGRIDRPVRSLLWHGGSGGRELEVSYEDGGHDRFACGPAGWQEARRAAAIAMRYIGRRC